MKTLFLLVIFSALCLPASATHYFLANASTSPAGNDGNAGTSAGVPWLSPNHALNCGDDITAVASTAYSASNFATAKWGTVTCAAGNDFAWLKCATFDACKISASSASGMLLSKSYWGVWGWEVTATGTSAPCFAAIAFSVSFHHVAFVNNVANGCVSSGFTTSSGSSTLGIDYQYMIGNIAWNATTTTALCDSGFTIYEPIKSDSLPGTHIFVAGNFAFDNASPTNCNAGSSTFDGNGLVFDDFGNAQSGGAAYDQQAVLTNNLAVWNGGNGVGNTGNGSANSHIYFSYNTSAKNQQATNASTTTCGDVMIIGPQALTELYGNLVVTKGSLSCLSSTQPLYAIAFYNGNATNHFYNNYLYSAAGNNIGLFTNNGFSAGPNNTTGTDPVLTNPVDPGQPNCTGKTSTVDCMATVIANYTPTTAAAKAFGYQAPTAPTIQTYDPFYPQILCNGITPTLLTGLITQHCVTPGSYRAAAPTNLVATVN